MACFSDLDIVFSKFEYASHSLGLTLLDVFSKEFGLEGGHIVLQDQMLYGTMMANMVSLS